MIIGGFLLAPARAFPAIASNITAPPMRVFTDAVSFNKKKNQMGPKITSVRDKSVSSTAGTDLDPIVKRIRPAPTWQIPIPIEIEPSFTVNKNLDQKVCICHT